MSDALEEAWRAYERGEPREVLHRLRDAPECAGRHACAALAHLDLGDYEAAERALGRAEAAGPTDPDTLLAAGEVHLAAWRVEHARLAFERLVEDSPSRAALERLSLCFDLLGEEAEADRALARAAAEDPAGGQVPRLDAEAFEAAVLEAAEELPVAFQRVLERIAIVIDPVPGIGALGPDPRETPPDLLGLFVGAALTEGSVDASAEMPPTIYLFQRNLQRAAADERELLEEIRTTLYHELGHALGFDEEGVAGLGLE
jgi:predicted Zn-dependent protease with MMP-like domain